MDSVAIKGKSKANKGGKGNYQKTVAKLVRGTTLSNGRTAGHGDATSVSARSCGGRKDRAIKKTRLMNGMKNRITTHSGWPASGRRFKLNATPIQRNWNGTPSIVPRNFPPHTLKQERLPP